LPLPLLVAQRTTAREIYEAEFINMFRAFKLEGIEGGIFGDIDFDEYHQWIEMVR